MSDLFPNKDNLVCHECGEPMFVSDGVSHHGHPGDVDYDADRDHVARAEEDELEYNTDSNGIITDPGKFEGEPRYAPYFSENAGDGEELSYLEDGTGQYVSLVDIEDEDRTKFPELGTAKYVLVTESDQGFITTELIETEEEAEQIRENYEEDEEPEDDEDDEPEEDEDEEDEDEEDKKV